MNIFREVFEDLEIASAGNIRIRTGRIIASTRQFGIPRDAEPAGKAVCYQRVEDNAFDQATIDSLMTCYGSR